MQSSDHASGFGHRGTGHAVADTARAAVRSLLGPRGMHLLRRVRHSVGCGWDAFRLVEKPADLFGLNILADSAFTASLREVRELSSLDTPRLANLWYWCGMSEEGAIVEVGAFRGGTTLHLSNRWPSRKIFACDTFDGFTRLSFDPDIDARFPRDSTWHNPDAASVAALFASRGRDATILAGIFPDSDRRGEIENVSFAYIDVDIYGSCRGALDYLSRRATPSAIFAVNDYDRLLTQGVTKAVTDFAAAHPDWMLLPAYPGQAVLLNTAGLVARRRINPPAG